MLNRYFSELLVLLLLLIASSRFLYIKKVKTDPLCILPLVSFLISILNIFAYGMSLFEMILLLLSFTVTIWNTRALLRFAANMVIDHYGFWFVFISTINLLITISFTLIVIYFRPVYVNTEKFNLQETTENLSGNLISGFYESKNMFSKKTAFFHTYTKKILQTPEESTEIVNKFNKEKEKEPRNVILFLPSIASNTDTYLPFFAKLAFDGYTVYSADFYTPDLTFFNDYRDLKILRTVNAANLKTREPKKYSNMVASNMVNIFRSYEALMKYADIQDGDFVFVVGDGDCPAALRNMKTYHSDKINGYYDLSDTDGYTTPGFGPVEQTNPFNANYLGYKRDKTLYMSSHIATALENRFQDAKLFYEMEKQLAENKNLFNLGENLLE